MGMLLFRLVTLGAFVCQHKAAGVAAVKRRTRTETQLH